MNDLNEKNRANNFLKVIDKYAKDQRKELKDQVKEFKTRELQKAEAEVLRDSYFLIQKEMATMKKDIARKVSFEEYNCKRTLLEKRQEILTTVFKKAQKRLIAFTQEPDYKQVLINYAKMICQKLKAEGTVLYVKAEDLKYMQDLQNAFEGKVEIRETGRIKIGGVFATNEKAGLKLDQTLDSKLMAEKEWFEENSGLRVV